jgi:hypothetical protein
MDLSTTAPAEDLPWTRGLRSSSAEHTRSFNSAVSWRAITVGAAAAVGDPDPGILMGATATATAKVERVAAGFIVALGRHHHPEPETSALAP